MARRLGTGKFKYFSLIRSFTSVYGSITSTSTRSYFEYFFVRQISRVCTLRLKPNLQPVITMLSVEEGLSNKCCT